MQPLQDILVVDLSRLVPGPLCTNTLAELGASVIKVEDDANPDYLKDIPPFTKKNCGSMYHWLNSRKTIVNLSIKSKKGQALLKQLIARADILVETFRPGVLKKLGLNPTQLLKANKKLLIVSISGYGSHSFMASKAGHDLNYQALAGTLNSTTHAPHFLWADMIGGGHYSVSLILAALYQRQRTKKGQHLDISLTQGLFYLNGLRWIQAQAGAQNNFLDGSLARYRIYQTKDGRFMALAALEDKFWNHWCSLMGKKTWKDAGGNYPDRRQSIHQSMETMFKTRTLAQWRSWSKKQDICLTPVWDIQDNELNKALYFEASGGLKRPLLSTDQSKIKKTTPDMIFKQLKAKKFPVALLKEIRQNMKTIPS